MGRCCMHLFVCRRLAERAVPVQQVLFARVWRRVLRVRLHAAVGCRVPAVPGEAGGGGVVCVDCRMQLCVCCRVLQGQQFMRSVLHPCMRRRDHAADVHGDERRALYRMRECAAGRQGCVGQQGLGRRLRLQLCCG